MPSLHTFTRARRPRSRDLYLKVYRTKLVVSVVATSRRKTGLWTGGTSILRWPAGMKQAFLAYFRVRRK